MLARRDADPENTVLRTSKFVCLFLTALGLVFGGAHVLELPAKMEYDPELYATVTSTLYRLFGLVGGPLQIAAILAAALLTVLVRHTPTFRPTLAGTLGLVLSLVLWSVLVAPVNAEWGEVLRSAPEAVPAAYARLRPRWEYGHVAAFGAWLVGFGLLLLAVVRETPAGRVERGA